MSRVNLLTQLVIVCIIYLITQKTYAKDLGVIGATFPIAETDLLQLLENRAQTITENGQWDAIQTEMNQAAEQQLNNPTPVSNIIRTQQPKSFLYDPSITLPFNIQNAEGHVILKIGTRVNPLDTISFNETWLFYNAGDPDQVAWAQDTDKSLKGEDKLILVGGSVNDQEKIFNKNVYFDQQGFITWRLGITQVPAIVKQEGKSLRIEEVEP